MPAWPSLEKYRSPFGRTVGNVSLPGVFTSAPMFSIPAIPLFVSIARQMSSPPKPPGMSLTKYSHLPSGLTAGCAKHDSVSFKIASSVGFAHAASLRLLVKIFASRGYCGSVVHCVRYIVCWSGEKQHAPSSKSLFSPPFTTSGRCHCPRSFFIATNMSPFLTNVSLGIESCNATNIFSASLYLPCLSSCRA